ncbi:unnamed protein product [Gongylonema pulchrum]|uniref:Outer membrane usher protein n=1 Tax=Gongylonema pulchrum TaxID=637853 RepID=A0A183DMX9_9BILA|nr:unnamed protein product [Gongylonema pulchrum]
MAHGSLMVEMLTNRVDRESQFANELSHQFQLRESGDQFFNFNFEPDEQSVNIGVSLDIDNASVVGVSYS